MARNFQGLRVAGDALVDPSGTPVILRGVGLGGWMNMENFITGYPANESAMREAVGAVLGWERADAFFERLLDRFFTREDAAFLAGLGVNCVRLPINQRHFESDADPFKWISRGFERLAAMVELLGAHGIYSVIDLHAVPGSQNQHWHSDNATHVAAFWKHPHFMERATALWVELALRFVGNPWVAGYNLLNEPADPTGAVVGPWHARTVAAVREVDPDHIVFLDGNTYSTDFSSFGDPVENAVYACHDYARDGMAFGGPYEGDRGKLEATFLKRTAYQRQTGTPIWVGEFGPVYTGVAELDEPRYALLQDQLALYASYGAGWSLWTYKDVGLQGLVYASPSSFYLRLFGEFMGKKARLGVDSWGSTDREQADVMEPLHALIAREFPAWEPYPWDARSTTDDLVRHLLFAQAMVPEYAAYFRGLDDDGLDALADSFALAACVRRDRLCEIVASATYAIS